MALPLAYSLFGLILPDKTPINWTLVLMFGTLIDLFWLDF